MNGLEIVQEGVGLAKALDSQKVLDSRYRYFEILIEKILTLPALLNNGSVQVIYEHNLGFLPAFDVYDTAKDAYITESDTSGNGLISSTSKLYFNGFYTDNGWGNHQVVIRIYNVPITEEYVATIEKTLPVKTSSSSKEGIKITQGTTDFNELELSRFSLNTSSKALSIQKTGLATANSGTNFSAIIHHDLGYPPTYLASYADINRQWISTIDPSFVPVKATADGVNLTFSGAQSALTGTFAYIIFKELGDFAL